MDCVSLKHAIRKNRKEKSSIQTVHSNDDDIVPPEYRKYSSCIWSPIYTDSTARKTAGTNVTCYVNVIACLTSRWFILPTSTSVVVLFVSKRVRNSKNTVKKRWLPPSKMAIVPQVPRSGHSDQSKRSKLCQFHLYHWNIRNN